MNLPLLFAYITGGIMVAFSLVIYIVPNRKMNLLLKAGSDLLTVINLVFVYFATGNSLVIAGMVTTAIAFFREFIFAARKNIKAFNHIAWPIGFSIVFLISSIFTYKSPLSLLPVIGSVVSALTFYVLDQRVFKGGALFSAILYVTYYAVLIPSSDVLTVFSLLCSVSGLISSAVGFAIVMRIGFIKRKFRRKNSMKKVLLLGDSIRMGYCEMVKNLLTEYEVYFDPEDNGRFSAYTIWQFNQLNKKYGPFDVVHFNNGYWDINKEGPNGEANTPLKDYVRNYKFLLKLIRETGATPIFATTLPLLDKEDLGENPNHMNYYNDSVVLYNSAALKLMNKEDVEINDLYSLIKKAPGYYKCDDKLHLTQEGYEVCAKQVASKIREVLK